MRWLLTGDEFSAAEALRMGLAGSDAGRRTTQSAIVVVVPLLLPKPLPHKPRLYTPPQFGTIVPP